MMSLILIHNTFGKDSDELFRETIDLLFRIFGDNMRIKRSYPPCIDIPDIRIRFAWGNDMCILMGVRPDYWYSDSWNASKILTQGAYAVDGKELKGITYLQTAIYDIYSRKGDKEC